MNYSKRRQPRNNLEEGNPPNDFHFPDEKIAPSQFNISSSTASTECPFLMHRYKKGRKCDCSNCIDPNQLSNVRAEPNRHRIDESSSVKRRNFSAWLLDKLIWTSVANVRTIGVGLLSEEECRSAPTIGQRTIKGEENIRLSVSDYQREDQTIGVGQLSE
jgi:hypothetical protein